MKKKKLLSVILASALAVSMMPFQAFAAPLTSDSASGSIGGNTSVASNAILKVKVPFDFNFVINPLELEVTGTGETEQIISTGYTFHNMSNMDVQLSVTPVFTSDSGIRVASSPDEIKNVPGEDATIFMQVAPSVTKPDLTGTPGDLKFASSTPLVFASGTGIAMNVTEETGTPNTAYFKLKSLKTAYATDGEEMTYDVSKNTDTDTDAIAVKFIGKVSQMSDWSTKHPKIQVKYKFDFISNDVFADADNEVSGTYRMVKENLAVTGPVFNLDSDGKISITGLPEGYSYRTMGFIMPTTVGAPINVSTSDIEAAITSAISQDKPFVGSTVGDFTIKEMLKDKHFSWNIQTHEGQLVMNSIHNFNLCIFTVSTNSDGDSKVIISPIVTMN